MFINAEILDGDIPNLVEFFRESMAGVFVETDQFFRFRINPNLLTVRKNKIISNSFTKTGFTFSHHGNDLTRLGYKGSTGYFEPPNVAQVASQIARIVPGFPRNVQDAEALRDAITSLLLSGQINITQSEVWQKFRRFEAFWDRIQSEMAMYYDQRLYRVQVTSFNYSEDASDPFQIKYDFEVLAHTDRPTGADRFGKALIHLGVR